MADLLTYLLTNNLYNAALLTDARLTAIIQNKSCKPTPKCLHSGFY